MGSLRLDDLGGNDPYVVLGLAEDATDDAVRAARRRMQKKLHSDVGGSTERSALVNNCADVLLDPVLRAEHDRKLRQAGWSHGGPETHRQAAPRPDQTAPVWQQPAAAVPPRRRRFRPAIVVLLCALVAAGILVPLAVRRQSLSNAEIGSALEGTWTGQYTCGRGIIGLRLTLGTPGPSTLRGRLDFYPVAANPRIPSGSFFVNGSFSAEELRLVGAGWASRPDPGWDLLTLRASMPRDAFTALGGEILNPGCSTWRATKERPGRTGQAGGEAPGPASVPQSTGARAGRFAGSLGP